MKSRWNPQSEGELRHLCGEGHSAGFIAKEFNCTRNAIIGKVNRLGLQLGDGPKRATLPHTALFSSQRQPSCAQRAAARQPSPPTRQTLRPPKAKRIKRPLQSSPCTVTELTADTCRWPLWGNERLGSEHYGLYCGGLAIEGSPYCGFHTRKASRHSEEGSK